MENCVHLRPGKFEKFVVAVLVRLLFSDKKGAGRSNHPGLP
jgi:hypothetical protein